MFRLMIAGMENETRIDKANAVYRRRRERAAANPRVAVGSRAPYGLQVVNGLYEPKAPESEAVRLTYEMRLEGYGFSLIAKRLREVAPPIERRDGSL
jgi:hypothetical protein